MTELKKLLGQHKSLHNKLSFYQDLINNYDTRLNDRKNTLHTLLVNTSPYKLCHVLREQINVLEHKLEKEVHETILSEFEDEEKRMVVMRAALEHSGRELDELTKQIKTCDDFSEKVDDYMYTKETVKRAKTYTKGNFAETFVGEEPHQKWASISDFNKACKDHHNYTLVNFVYKPTCAQNVSTVSKDRGCNQTGSNKHKRDHSVNNDRPQKKARK